MTTLANTLSRSIRKRSRPNKQYADQIEMLRGIPGGIVQSIKDSAKNTIDAKQWETYLGFGKEEKQKHKRFGEMRPGEEIDLRSVYKEEEEKQIPNLDIAPNIDYFRDIRNFEKTATVKLNRETNSKIQEILIELKKLVATTQELQTQFKDVAVTQTVVNPGKYHESFFEWLLSIVKSARKKVEDSGAWLSAMQSKNSKKSYYWRNADEKVGGTSFQLSSERVVATQVG